MQIIVVTWSYENSERLSWISLFGLNTRAEQGGIAAAAADDYVRFVIIGFVVTSINDF